MGVWYSSVMERVGLVFILIFGCFSAQAQNCRGLFIFAPTPATLFVGRPYEIDVDRRSISELQTHANVSVSNQAARDIAKILKQRNDDQVETVVYPSAGYDAGTAFTIFANARTVIGIDQHPFIERGTFLVRAEIPPDIGDMFTQGFEVSRQSDEAGMAPAILGSLAANLPGFRLRRLMTVSQNNGQHGWIEFDLGEGTPTRKYIHIDHTIPLTPPISEWAPKLEYQGLLIKGAMTIFNPVDPKGGGVFLLDYLARNGGVAVDADIAAPEATKFLDEQEKAHSQGRTNYLVVSTDISLGYASGENKTHNGGTKIIEYHLSPETK